MKYDTMLRAQLDEEGGINLLAILRGLTPCK